jgi:hypothetical protein
MASTNEDVVYTGIDGGGAMMMEKSSSFSSSTQPIVDLIMKENLELKLQLQKYQNQELVQSTKVHRWPKFLGWFSYDPRLATMLITSGGIFGLYPAIFMVEMFFGYNSCRFISNFAYIYGISEFIHRYLWENSFVYVIPVLGWISGQYDNFPLFQDRFPILSEVMVILMMYMMCMILLVSTTKTTGFLFFGFVFILKRLLPTPNLGNVASPGFYFSFIVSTFAILYQLHSFQEIGDTKTFTMSMLFISDWGWKHHVDFKRDHLFLISIRYGSILSILFVSSCLLINVIHKLIVSQFLIEFSFFLDTL